MAPSSASSPGGARLLVVGGGAREHALAWRLASSPHVGQIYCAPGNPGIAELATLLPISVTDVVALTAAAVDLAIDLVVIGPEAPLAAGLADALTARGVPTAGPCQAAAVLESSKAFAKEIMAEAGIPTAAYHVFTSPTEAEAYVNHAPLPLVVKADGLAAGKGVTICATRGEALAAMRASLCEGAFGTAGHRIIIEEYLDGQEVSVLAVTDGRRVLPLLPAQDHKRLYEGDRGPNTGGMGAIAPSPALSAAGLDTVRRTILEPAIAALAERGITYRGVLYAGLICTRNSLRVLEFNCRFGDPEAQVLLPLLQTDLYELLAGCAAGTLSATPLRWHDGATVGITLAAPGYPEAPVIGGPITQVKDAMPDLLLFHGATARDANGHLITAGGRVITVVGQAPTVAGAVQRCLPPPVTFPGMHYRRDIGSRALATDAPAREAPLKAFAHG